MILGSEQRKELVKELAERLRDEEWQMNAGRDMRDQGPLSDRQAAEIAIRFLEERI